MATRPQNKQTSRRTTPRKTAQKPRKATSVRKKGKKIQAKKVKVSPWAAIGIASALLLILFLTFHRWQGSDFETGAKVPPGEWRYGIDISHNNEGRIVWDSLFVMTDSRGRTVRDPYKAKEITPVSFVVIKATEGAGFIDEDFKENWEEARHSDIRRGAYHFFRSSKDGELQARNYIRTVGELRRKDLPPVLDIETIHRGCTKEVLNKRALQWLKVVEKHYGRKPIVYSGALFAKDYLSKEIRENYPIWVAHYEKDSPAYEDWIWWQCTDKAVVRGVPGRVDLNLMKVN